MSLSGRVDALESNITHINQDLLRRVDIVTHSQLQVVWNQQLDVIEDAINSMQAKLSTLQTLYTNLYKSVVDNNALFTGHTGQILTGSDPAHGGIP